jgi:hypothetical protein
MGWPVASEGQADWYKPNNARAISLGLASNSMDETET